MNQNHNLNSPITHPNNGTPHNQLDYARFLPEHHHTTVLQPNSALYWQNLTPQPVVQNQNQFRQLSSIQDLNINSANWTQSFNNSADRLSEQYQQRIPVPQGTSLINNSLNQNLAPLQGSSLNNIGSNQNSVPLQVPNLRTCSPHHLLAAPLQSSSLDDRSLSSNHVYNVLIGDGQGEFLLKAYDYYYNKVDKSRRSELRNHFDYREVCRIVLWEEFRVTRQYNIPPTRLHQFAELTNKVFPAILVSTLYSPRGDDGNPHGAYQSAYDTIKDKFYSIELTTRNVGKRKKTIVEEDKEFDPEKTEDFKLLQVPVTNISPEYLTKWLTTAKKEKTIFYSKNDPEKILNKLPNLVLADGYKLIAAEYSIVFDKSCNIIDQKWPEEARKLFSYAKNLKRNKEVKTFLKVHENISEDDRNVLAFYLLVLLIKRVNKTTKSSSAGVNWTPTVDEVFNNFILLVKETNDFYAAAEAKIARLKQLHSDHGFAFHPFLVIVNGNSLREISAVYVYVAKYFYKVNSVLAAVELCFQFVKVFKKPFMILSNHIWNYMETQIFSFEETKAITIVNGLKQSISSF